MKNIYYLVGAGDDASPAKRQTRSDVARPGDGTASLRTAGHATVVTADQLEMISADPGVRHGQAVTAGTRVPASVILDRLAAGMTAEEITAEYPTVTVAGVGAAAAYGAALAREEVLPCRSHGEGQAVDAGDGQRGAEFGDSVGRLGHDEAERLRRGRHAARGPVPVGRVPDGAGRLASLGC